MLLLIVVGELDANRPVPFRLTPNITEFLTTVGVNGILTACMIASARCFVQPAFQTPALLRAILRDEMIAWDKKVQAVYTNVLQTNGIQKSLPCSVHQCITDQWYSEISSRPLRFIIFLVLEIWGVFPFENIVVPMKPRLHKVKPATIIIRFFTLNRQNLGHKP